MAAVAADEAGEEAAVVAAVARGWGEVALAAAEHAHRLAGLHRLAVQRPDRAGAFRVPQGALAVLAVLVRAGLLQEARVPVAPGQSPGPLPV
jgi:hypothetical protein